MNSTPFVTVIMPVLNEAAYIERSLGSILSQDYPSDRMEIIVADGMSNDATREIIRKISEANGHRTIVTIIDNPEKIVPTGLNAAIAKARGEIIIRIDGHSIPPRDYVSRCVENLLKSGAECVGGATISIGGNYTARVIAAAVSSPLGAGNSAFRTAATQSGPIPAETLQFPAIRRNVFERIGPFNAQMVRHQDYEFHYRLRKAGGKILLYPELKVQYFVRKNLAALWRQYWQYGIWKGRFMKEHPDSIKMRHAIPPLFVLSITLSLLLSIIFPIFLTITSSIVLTYVAYLLMCMFIFIYQGNAKYAPLLPAALFTLHFSYGLGICLGWISGRGHR